MKLPFNSFIAPMMKPYLAETKNLCENPTFSFSIPYTYFYSTLGFLISANHLRKHLGENPVSTPSLQPTEAIDELEKDFMLVHDLKIIATSLGIVQYACLLAGCYTENPALFLPHLTGQLVVVTVKIVNSFMVVPNRKSFKQLMHRLPAILLMTFNWLQEFCVFRQTLCILSTYDEDFLNCLKVMEPKSNTLLDQFQNKQDNRANGGLQLSTETSEGVRIRLRALLVALLGISMSACAFASQPVELELDDDDVAQKLNNVSFARRITKPTIRLVMGYGKFSAFVTALSSLLLLVAVMSKQAWWRRGARWLAAPALLVAALEAASDAGDAMIAAVLRGSAEPVRVALQTTAAAVLVTVEILVWYFIAKFFEHNPPLPQEQRDKISLMETIPQ